MRSILNFAARVWLLLAALSLFLSGCATPVQPIPPPSVSAVKAAPRVNDGGSGWWLDQIAGSIAVRSGPCKPIAPRCDLFIDPLLEAGWIVIYGDPRSDEPTVILLEKLGGPALVQWCKPEFCPKGVI